MTWLKSAEMPDEDISNLLYKRVIKRFFLTVINMPFLPLRLIASLIRFRLFTGQIF